MVNLLEETISALLHHGKKPDDVLWVGDTDKKTTWKQFASIANFYYDNGYGGNEIDSSLIVVGKDFWLERGEYDGSEWWEYKELPVCKSEVFTDMLCCKEDWVHGMTWKVLGDNDESNV